MFCGEGLYFNHKEGMCFDKGNMDVEELCGDKKIVGHKDITWAMTDGSCRPDPLEGFGAPEGSPEASSEESSSEMMSRRKRDSDGGCGGGGCGGGGSRGGGSGGGCGGGSRGGCGGGSGGGGGGGSQSRGGSGSSRGGSSGGGSRGGGDPRCTNSRLAGQSEEPFFIPHDDYCNAFFTCSPTQVLAPCIFCPETLYFDEVKEAN
uniref:Chitin-binding type-2 domain-containing protein n=1 Tax=Biomphalaria glabrata TaxID=6526 RepID=A0A2C9L9K1_BIOGL